jgi:hypothetical protein
MFLGDFHGLLLHLYGRVLNDQKVLEKFKNDLDSKEKTCNSQRPETLSTQKG